MLAVSRRAATAAFRHRGLATVQHGGASFEYQPPDPVVLPRIVRKNNVDLIHDPLFNKVRVKSGTSSAGQLDGEERA